MYTYEILPLEQFSPKEIAAFENLQQPLYISSPKFIDLLSPDNRHLMAIRVKCGEIPIALLLARVFLNSKIGEVISLFVTPTYRRQKIASEMIRLLKQYASSQKIKNIGMVYATTTPDCLRVESFLKNTGFDHKRFCLAEFQLDYALFHPPWFKKEYPLPADFEIFPWTELTFRDRLKIDLKYAQGIIPFDVYPQFHTASFEPLNSLGLRYKEDVVGWVLTERTLSNTIHYKNIYIDYDFQFTGVAIYQLVESLKIHAQNHIKWGIFKINMISSSGRWIHFVRRRLAPYASYIYEYASQSLLLD